MDVWVVEEETEKTDVAEEGFEEGVRCERGAVGGRAVRCSSRFHVVRAMSRAVIDNHVEGGGV